ncbi:hypothetical protein JZ751_000095 [Albula glossodonta]|uniref:Uncharacterized protein n=1 Tax=Albula glossodonta TaxID=121402 RepID=A0A8T2PUW3_9TELE|nr:hypothetical protein JZ751_000095 [Albula glossodonta]
MTSLPLGSLGQKIKVPRIHSVCHSLPHSPACSLPRNPGGHSATVTFRPVQDYKWQQKLFYKHGVHPREHFSCPSPQYLLHCNFGCLERLR